LSIKGDDRWGNPSNRLTGKIKLKTNLPVTGLAETIDLKAGDFGAVIEGLSVESPGVLHLSVLDEDDQLIATGKPASDPPSRCSAFLERYACTKW
jgi:hypothetical protein